MNALKVVVKDIKKHPHVYVAAFVGAAVGSIVTHKVEGSFTPSLTRLNKALGPGYEVLIMTRELADKIAPLNQQ